MFKVFVKDVLIDPIFGTPVLNMQLEGRSDFFKIWVGKNEGMSIGGAMCGLTSPRPNSHDTTANIITKLGVTLEKVVITDLLNNTFYANMTLKPNESTVTIDSRPSDAIALAIRLGAPIFITMDALKKISNDGFNDLNSLKKSMNEPIGDELKPEDFM